MTIEQNTRSDDDRVRQDLVEWQADSRLVRRNTAQAWHKGSTYHYLPNKSVLAEKGIDAICEGWVPAEPLITPDSRVIAIGSCFARYFVMWLAEHGFNKALPGSPYGALLSSPKNSLVELGINLESSAVVAQQFRWAFGEIEERDLLWIDTDKNVIPPSEERRQIVQDTLKATDVLIISLGLSELWHDSITGEPLWRALTIDQFDPERHKFQVESMAQSLHWLETIARLRAEHAPNMKIVFTVSPVRLHLTFRPISAISANNASKAIVRASLDEFLRNHSDEVSKHLFYFPSYEIATEYFVDAHEQDNQHISSTVAAGIIGYFVEHYCSAEMSERTGRPMDHLEGAGQNMERFMQASRVASTDPRAGALLSRIAELESIAIDLQKVCDERQTVINELDHAARERLDLIHRLDAEIKRLTAD